MRGKKIAAILILSMSAGLILSACGAGGNDDDAYTEDFFAMDTYMTLTAYGENAEDAVNDSRAEIERLDAYFSTGDEESEIYALNSAGGGELSDEAAMLIRRCLNIWEETDGIFDISIYPVMKLWGFADGNYAVPDQDRLEEALALVDAGRLVLTEDEGAAHLSADEGMEIDLGGIVKGYALDRAAEIYAGYGIEEGLINLGGDVHLVGTKAGGELWRVGVVDPDDTDAYLGSLVLTDTAVVTSGGYERYFEDDETGVRYHHIIDPRTGYSAYNGLISVSVVSDDGTLADALSTSLFIMGYPDAVTYCEEHCAADGFDALMETDDGEIYITVGIEESFADINGDTELHVIYTE